MQYTVDSPHLLHLLSSPKEGLSSPSSTQVLEPRQTMESALGSSSSPEEKTLAPALGPSLLIFKRLCPSPDVI